MVSERSQFIKSRTNKETFKKIIPYFLDSTKRQKNAVVINNYDSEWIKMSKK